MSILFAQETANYPQMISAIFVADGLVKDIILFLKQLGAIIFLSCKKIGLFFQR